MQAGEHGDVVAEVGGIVASVLAADQGVEAAVSLLDRVEQAAGTPVVDESERARLDDLASGRTQRSSHWHSVVARDADLVVGYAGLVMPRHEDEADQAVGDVAIDRARASEALLALLAAVDTLGRRHGTRRLQVWLRHATDEDLHEAAVVGYCVDRRLGVLSRRLDDLDPAAMSRHPPFDTFTDDDADEVVEVLAAAYAGTDDAGWTREQFDGKRAYAWFDPDDLLVARAEDGRIVGLHWTKRRGEGVGEVYNLAVHPEAQGGRLGVALLHAGLMHLREAGCHTAMLWVDLANERAVRLYTAQGFGLAWEDVALGRALATDQPSSTSRLRSSAGTSL